MVVLLIFGVVVLMDVYIEQVDKFIQKLMTIYILKVILGVI